jgi:hypothetical protein
LADAICNTSPLQYLHQIGKLDVLPRLVQRVLIPPAVVSELAAGRARALDLPDPSVLDWIEVRQPAAAPAFPLATDLGPGEAEVLALGLERRDAVLILDDAVARRTALTLGLNLTGTLGVLIDAKRAGLIANVTSLVDQLQALRFRVAPHTRLAVLKLAGEA